MSYYNGVAGIYFWKILKTIAAFGQLKTKSVLDFGCGEGNLKKIAPNIINYDSVSSLSDIDDWSKINFDTLVANEVFYEFRADQLRQLLLQLREKNPRLELIVGISRQGFVNKLGAFFLRRDAYNKAQLSPNDELNVLKEFCDVIDKTAVWGLCDIYKMTFKNIETL